MPLKYYKSTEVPSNVEQGDLRFNVNNNQLDSFNTTDGWGQIRFPIANFTQLRPATAWASTNSADSVMYVPAINGAPVASITSLGGRSAIVVDTTRRAICFWSGGSWFSTTSLSLA